MRNRKSLLFRLAVTVAVAAALPPSLAWAAGQNVTGTVSFSASFTETITAGFPTPVTASEAVSQTTGYTATGTGSGQLDTCYASQVTLAASTPQTFDLTALTDPAGKTANFARVREFVVQNTTTTATYDVKVSAAASNGWPVLPASTDTNVLYARSGSLVHVQDRLSAGSGVGNVVGASTKSFTLDPGSNGPIVVNVWIVGCSAQ